MTGATVVPSVTVMRFGRRSVISSKATVTGLLSQAHDHAERVALERDLAAEVAAQGLPTLRLPALPTGVEDGGITVLADALTAQGVR